MTVLRIEGRQRSRAYVTEVVRSSRAAVDALEAGRPILAGALAALSEGQATAAGAHSKRWR